MSQSETQDANPPIPTPGAGIDWWTMLTDPAFLASPHAELKRIRELGPVHRDGAFGVYFVLGHGEFRQMAMAPEMGRDTRLWSNGWNTPENKQRDPVSFDLFSEFQRQMVNANPPDHRRMRDVYEKALRPAQMAQLQPMIEAECRRLLDELPVDSPVDFMTAFANHLPLRVSRNLFEISPDMDPQMAQWNAALVKIGDIMMSPDQKQEALAALREYKAFLRDHLEARRGNPGEGLIALALAALDDGTMDEEETLNNLLGLVTGNENTVTVLGNGLLTLLRHPAELARLRADPDLVKSAIEEVLRYEPSINFILRVAIKDYQLGDVLIPAGALAIGLVAAINRDPARFDEPEVFDIARQPNAQFIFGGGPHVCIGASLARLEAQVGLSAMLERFPRIELAGEPVWWADRTNQRGLQSLPVRLGR
ncbi:cytochrome P450 [Azorhizobium doebereinerae]|uniref:cytochrome P450 n=1 Tax=Azorhizobium doebereinerae TaxID=281091 RepID=UPI00041A552C|nr:cytochrome P450 [Azorhizobium doebereinerae]